MKRTMNIDRSMPIVVVFALSAGCAAEATPLHGALLASCGPAGGTQFVMMLDEDAACTAEPEGNRIIGYFHPDSFDTPGRVEVGELSGAQLCRGAACVDVARGLIEVIVARGDERQLLWSLELADGAEDDGEVLARLCDAPPRCH